MLVALDDAQIESDAGNKYLSVPKIGQYCYQK